MNFNNVNQMDYLVYSDLKNLQVVNSICYVVSVENSVSKIDTNFYRLIVRTVDGKQMVCTILDVHDFDKLGYRLNAIVNKYVKLEALVQEFNGRFSLRFINLNVIDAVTPDLVMKFQKAIDGIEDYYSDVNSVYSNVCGESFPLILKNKSYPSIYDGYAGGFLKLTWDMMIRCQAMFQDLPFEESLEVMFKSLMFYSTYMNRRLEYNLITDSDKITMVSELPNNTFVGRLVRETCASLIGLGKPNHIICVLIWRAFNDIMEINDLKRNWDLMMIGGVTECHGVELYKY